MFPFEDCILECIIYVTVSDPYRVEGVGVRLGFLNLTLFQTKICNFPIPFFKPSFL